MRWCSSRKVLLGLHHIFGGPELVVVCDLPDFSQHLQSLIGTRIIQEAAYQVTKAITAGDEDERVVAARLCAREYVLPDARCGVFSTRMEQGYEVPGLCRGNSVVQLPELMCREVGAAITWRFLPRPEAERTYGGPNRGWCSRSGATVGRATTVFYGDNAGLTRPYVYQMPFHVCSLAACFAAVPKRMTQKVLAALRNASHGVPRERIYTPAPQGLAGVSPAIAAVMAEQLVQGRDRSGVSLANGTTGNLTASFRSRMFQCALEGCDTNGAELKQCSACSKVAYCWCVLQCCGALHMRT